MSFLKRLFGRSATVPPPNFLNRNVAIPVFCYHGVNIRGVDYAQNDHEALRQDLISLEHCGYRLLPPVTLARALRGDCALPAGKLACITFDDGSDLDYYDYDHPDAGPVESLHGILASSPLIATRPGREAATVAFVIVSPEARRHLVDTCFLGQDLIRDVWWRECAQKSIIGIGNHSWDHTHETLDTVCQADNLKGSFHTITTYAEADQQIRAAQDYIDHITGNGGTPLFAYPYGHAADYLVNEYFPNHEKEHRLLAAFGTGGEPVTRNSNLWALPRYVCGEHWRTPEDFRKILSNLGNRS